MRPNIVAAIVLIAIGTVFLLDNLGLADISLGRLIRTGWPAILIVVGLGMLFRPHRKRQDD
ncbi:MULTISPECIES: DUF5668 domain-containing protein [unclassified Lysobacter]|uniref:LiaI-LiaF-like domain-containing protein n=1 Tax=unclassified Lysobacter TaxID=2635362 RepID=UPI0006FC748D|nr:MULTISPECIES: DUF5668 domain-containing protein [unclassified Lysobacter]KRA21036.1 hypothetical protein ASD69_07025 [Lysobacter sp. Root604]KRD40041.1 hypothetical protein ASE35_06965 [Lysobacter sp. Root916]KRD80070.1 hypothetical protein ASE43_04075 [Lysobacter sp. Root983]